MWPGTVQSAVKRTGYADFWELYNRNVLPKETRNYVPIILAVTIMAKNPAQYGLDSVMKDKPVPYDTVKIDYPIDLRLAAECVDATADDLLGLNPSLLRMTTPKLSDGVTGGVTNKDEQFELHLPAGTAAKFQTAVASIPTDKRVWWRYHKVQAGETLTGIARTYHTSPKAIAEANDLNDEMNNGAVAPESRLIIPIAPGKQSDTSTYAHSTMRYKIRKGDTVESQNPAASGRAGTYSTLSLHVATPAVLRYLGISPATINPATEFLTIHAGPLVVTTPSTFATVTHVQRLQAPAYTSQPTSLITLDGLHRRRWTQIQSGWLIQSGKPLTAAQLTAARDVAATAGLITETRNSQASLATISAAATAAGALLALGVLAMTVALIRTEAARRPAHPHRRRSHQHHPAHPHRRHCRRAGPARRAARNRRRLPRAGRRTPQRPRHPEPRATPVPRHHSSRRSRRRCPHRLDPRRAQATIHRPPRARITPAPCRLGRAWILGRG